MSGTVKLSQDMATLVNNRQGSDIQFKVGGRGETIYDESTTVTLYAHSIILRCRSQYFAAMLDEEKNWRENSKGIIYKPNISPSTFQDVLHYIYTGNVRAKASENIIELIAAAEEMDLEELSVECQAELIRIIEYIFSDLNDSDDENEISEETFEGSTKIPLDVAIHTHIIPALDLANGHSLSHLSQGLFDIILPNMPVIIKSPDVYTTFISNISSESLAEIIASDNLAMTECNVWNLVLRWGCHQTNLQIAAVDARLANLKNDDDKESSDGVIISDTQLNQLKTTLSPLLPAIRFSLLDPDDYAQMINTLSYFLSHRRFLDPNQYFLSTTHTGQLDTPRALGIMVESTTWKILKKNIFETGCITGCPSIRHLKFDLLFRASQHGFLASTFHEHCDDKGPTLTLVRSDDGHLFGGVNFSHWDSYDTSPSNFLFAIPDGHHRKNTLIFENTDSDFATYSDPNYGPIFGIDDLVIESGDSNNLSHSILSLYYDGSEASKTALAGTEEFIVSDYEVFAISIYNYSR